MRSICRLRATKTRSSTPNYIYGQFGAPMFEDVDCGDEDWHVEDDRDIIAAEFGWLMRGIEGGAS
jgi:hypothetical protein